MPLKSRDQAIQRLDERLAPFKSDALSPAPKVGWLKALRSALGMSGTQMSQRLGMTRQAVSEMERSEAAGTITLNTLRKAADALDCDLVYALVPRTSLEGMVASRARQLAERDLARVGQTMALEDQSSSPEERRQLLEDYIREHIREKDLWNLP